MVVAIKFGDFFSVPKALLLAIGLPSVADPAHIRSQRFMTVAYTWYWIIFVNLFIGVLGQVIYFRSWFETSGNFIKITGQAPCIAFAAIGLAEMVLMWKNRQRTKCLVLHIAELYDKYCPPADQPKYGVKDVLRDTKITMFNFVAIFFITITLFNFVPFIEIARVYQQTGEVIIALPYYVWFPFDPYRSDVFVWVYAEMNLWGFTTIVILLSNNLLMGSIISQLCLQFNILAHKLSRLSGTADAKDIIELVKQHNDLISYSDEARNLYSPSLFSNYLFNSFIICTSGFVIVFNDSVLESVKFSFFFLCILIQTLSFSYYGNRITECSQDIARAIYNAEWYAMKPRNQRCVILIGTRASSRPQYLKAANYITVSMQSFTSILSRSYQYFTLLHTIYKT